MSTTRTKRSNAGKTGAEKRSAGASSTMSIDGGGKKARQSNDDDDNEPFTTLPTEPQPRRTGAVAEIQTAPPPATASQDPFALLNKTMQTGPRFGATDAESAAVEDTFDGNRDPQGVLSRTGIARLLDVEDIVRRQLVAVDASAYQNQRKLIDDYSKRIYVLRGLSQTAPNPQYAALLERRKRLEQQADFIRRQRDEYDALFYQYGIAGPRLVARDAEDLDEQRIRFLDGFRPPQALSLLKPSQEIGRLNGMWREHLGGVLDRLVMKYTIPGNTIDPDGGTRSPYAPELIAYHVNPIVERRFADLRHTSFEDMPLPLQVVQEYFNKYLTAAFNRLLNPVPPSDQAEQVELDELAGDASASSLGHAFRVDSNQEEAVMLVYYSSVIAAYANRIYRGWHSSWVASLSNNNNINLNDDSIKTVLGKLDSFVEQLVRTADRRDVINGVSVYHANRPLDWLEYERRYEELVFNEIARHRVENLPEYDFVHGQLQLFFESLEADDVFPRELLLNLRFDTPVILIAAYNNAAALVDGSNANKVATLARRLQFANTLIGRVIRDNELHWPHAPNETAANSRRSGVNDNVTVTLDNQTNQLAADSLRSVINASGTRVDYWSVYDLAYPIDFDLSRDAIFDINRTINQIWPMFDFEASHEKAEERRRAFDALYANKRLVTELSQVDYLLNHVLTETIEQPQQVTRMVYDTAPFELQVQLELAPELASRILYVPEKDRRNADAVATEAAEHLSRAQFRVTWLRRSPTTGVETVIATTDLDAGSSTSRIILSGGSAVMPRPELVLDIAGQYRAFAQELDSTGMPIGKVYDSAYTAHVSVFAQCMRDGVLYVPVLGAAGTQYHRECEWHPPPIDQRHESKLLALKTLVTQGNQAYEKLRTEQRVAAVKAETSGSEEEPPWGTSDADNLEHVASQGDEAVHELFSFYKIVGKFVRRFATALRETTGSAISLPSASDLQIIGLFLSKLADVSSIRDPGLIMATANEPADITRHPLVDLYKIASILQGGRLPTAKEPLFNAADFSADLGSIPIASLITALRQPFVIALQTPRERRYFVKLVTDFGAYRDAYRTSIANECRIRLQTDHAEYQPTVAAKFEADMAAEFRAITMDRVMGKIITHGLRLPVQLFYDDQSETEFRLMIRNLRSYEYSRPNGAVKPIHEGWWFGTHSFASAQPNLTELAQSSAVVVFNGVVTKYPKRLVIDKRASEPLGRGYDYTGLHEELVNAVRNYNDIAVSPANMEELQQAFGRAEVLVTINNYFVFLAPELPKGTFQKARDIVARATNGHYTGVFFYPTPTETTLPAV